MESAELVVSEIPSRPRRRELAIDPMSAASPELSAADTAALQESIKTLGQLVPIVLYKDKVLDGRKRLAACQALGREPVTVTIPDEATAANYALALNVLRTHYSTAQRAMYVSALATFEKGWNLRQHQRVEGEISPSTKTAAEAAALVGVTESAVKDAKAVRRNAVPEVVAAVERGELSLYAAKQIVATVPKADQATTVARAVAAKGTRRPTTREKPKALIMARSLSAIENACWAFEDCMKKPGGEPKDRTSWVAKLDTILATLRRCRRSLSTERGASPSPAEAPEPSPR